MADLMTRLKNLEKRAQGMGKQTANMAKRMKPLLKSPGQEDRALVDRRSPRKPKITPGRGAQRMKQADSFFMKRNTQKRQTT